MNEVQPPNDNERGPFAHMADELTPDIVNPVVRPVAEAADTALDKAKRLGGAVVSMVRVAFTGQH
jgi:hypothetical protein